ncbi:hypothetical protein Q4543_05875 [Salipiger sp. 1_MG-2023]|uniref:hypothetical protein n=1 Tax=Salipiger sp. 1_MG-2023 TaxID=3062665 RepID=UPI0026E329D1|nr:hypothetical protein [Salipiger sp. 1_MG-2023]MDO6585039.1 hypothetical protein [Salipiger sp. 1_MG-2023]
MTFDFGAAIDRRQVHPKVPGQDGAGLFAASVADMDFRPPPPVIQALAERLAHGMVGNEPVPDGLLPALSGCMKTRRAADPAGQHPAQMHDSTMILTEKGTRNE